MQRPNMQFYKNKVKTLGVNEENNLIFVLDNLNVGCFVHLIIHVCLSIIFKKKPILKYK